METAEKLFYAFCSLILLVVLGITLVGYGEVRAAGRCVEIVEAHR
jgi:hypothetical protein